MKKRSKKEGPELPCGELGPDDGIDPKILFREEGRRREDNNPEKRKFILKNLKR